MFLSLSHFLHASDALTMMCCEKKCTEVCLDRNQEERMSWCSWWKLARFDLCTHTAAKHVTEHAAWATGKWRCHRRDSARPPPRPPRHHQLRLYAVHLCGFYAEPAGSSSIIPPSSCPFSFSTSRESRRCATLISEARRPASSSSCAIAARVAMSSSSSVPMSFR